MLLPSTTYPWSSSVETVPPFSCPGQNAVLNWFCTQPVDLLFIDTWHVYGHLRRELEQHHLPDPCS